MGQFPQTFERETPRRLWVQYLLFLPEQYESDEKPWPLMLFLHGAGERGDNLDLVKAHGPPKIVEEWQDFPFIVTSPQCPEGERWTTDTLNGLLDEIVSKFRVDQPRFPRA